MNILRLSMAKLVPKYCVSFEFISGCISSCEDCLLGNLPIYLYWLWLFSHQFVELYAK